MKPVLRKIKQKDVYNYNLKTLKDLGHIKRKVSLENLRRTRYSEIKKGRVWFGLVHFRID